MTDTTLIQRLRRHRGDYVEEMDEAADALEQQAHAAKVASDMAEIRERVIAHQKDIIRDQAAQIAEKDAEIARLTECLSKANANHEHFERAWYLRGDEIEALRADAERLDFLESKRLPAYTVWNVTRHWRTDGSNDMEERSTFEGWSVVNQSDPLPTIREAIDAALRQEQPT